MSTVRQLLAGKGDQVHAVAPGDMVYEAIRRMAEHGVGALLVMEGERLVGIVSERDYARKVILQGKGSRDTAVADIMTRELVTARPELTVPDCMQLMTERRIRHLPVLEGDRVVGVLSIGDLVKAIISEQRREIEQLSQYIAG
jgi:CBS domain-containing protein